MSRPDDRLPTEPGGTATTAGRRWFAHVQADPPGRLRLFCLPCAGGGASVFRGWRERLSPDVEIYPIQSPGRENRLAEQPYGDIDRLVDALTPVLPIDKPYALLGHSTGALIMYRLARRLQGLGAPLPTRLFAVAYRAPHLPCHDEEVMKHQLDDEAFVVTLRKFAGTPEELLRDRKLLQIFLPAIRADIAISETYRHRPTPPLDVPISVFGGTRDPIVNREELGAWQQHTAHPISARMFPSGHFLFDDAAHLVLEAVRHDLHGDLRRAPEDGARTSV